MSTPTVDSILEDVAIKFVNSYIEHDKNGVIKKNELYAMFNDYILNCDEYSEKNQKLLIEELESQQLRNYGQSDTIIDKLIGRYGTIQIGQNDFYGYKGKKIKGKSSPWVDNEKLKQAFNRDIASYTNITDSAKVNEICDLLVKTISEKMAI